MEISADDIFLGVIDSMELIMPLDQTFFAVVGMQNIQHLQKHINKLFKKNTLNTSKKTKKKADLKLDPHMHQIFFPFTSAKKAAETFDSETSIQLLNPFKILHECMPYLSNKLKKLLEADNNEYEVIKNTL